MIQWVNPGWMVRNSPGLEQVRHCQYSYCYYPRRHCMVGSWEQVRQTGNHRASEEARPTHRATSPAGSLCSGSAVIPPWSCFNAHWSNFQIRILNLPNFNWLRQHARDWGNRGVTASPSPWPEEATIYGNGLSSVLAPTVTMGPAYNSQTSLTHFSKLHEGGKGYWKRVWEFKVVYDHGFLSSPPALLSHSCQTPPHPLGREAIYSQRFFDSTPPVHSAQWEPKWLLPSGQSWCSETKPKRQTLNPDRH